jgi:alkylation response protein AidB-like acyl-CoA dehydrogenase
VTDSAFHTIAARALAGAAYLEAGNRGLQFMGGMGAGREHPIGRYHSTGLALAALGGSTRTNRQVLASVARSSPSTLRSPVVP